MRIIVHADGGGSLAVQAELRIAMQTLTDNGVPLDGGGFVGTRGAWQGVVLLRRDSDKERALELLADAGIQTSIGPK